MPYCSKCGGAVSGAASFCSACGTQVVSPEKVPLHSFQSRWLFLAIILSFALSVLLQQLFDRVEDDVGSYLMYVLLAGFCLWIIRIKKILFKPLIGELPGGLNWWPVLLMAIAGVVYSIGSVGVVLVPLVKIVPEFVEEILSIQIAGSLANMFVLTVILAPLIEELIFRGLLFSRLTEKWGMIRGVVISSMIFAAFHFNPIGAFVFGVVACVLYVRTQTLLVPMVMHALHNLIVVILTLVEQGTVDTAIVMDQFAYPALIAMLLSSPFVFVLLGRWWPSRGSQLPYYANQKAAQDAESSFQEA